MSAQARGTTAAASAPGTAARTRGLAARLAGLFEADRQIVLELNDAHDRLAAANDRLWRGPVIDPLAVHHEVHSAFHAYQQASEQRRQLAAGAGELSAWLTDALMAAGHSPEQARSANVHELAAGTWQPAQTKEMKR